MGIGPIRIPRLSRASTFGLGSDIRIFGPSSRPSKARISSSESPKSNASNQIRSGAWGKGVRNERGLDRNLANC